MGSLKDDYDKLSEQLKEMTKARNNVDAGLKNAERQAKDQRKQLRMTETNLETERQMVKDLRAELQKAKDAAQLIKEAAEAEKQVAYRLGVEETQVRLTGEFSAVCRDYCDITWGKAFDAAGVPAESDLR